MIRSCSGRTSAADVRHTSPATSRMRPAAEPSSWARPSSSRSSMARRTRSSSRSSVSVFGGSDGACSRRGKMPRRRSPDSSGACVVSLVSIDASLVQGAARGRPAQHRARPWRTHVSDVGKWCGVGRSFGSPSRAILSRPGARTLGDRPRRRVAQLGRAPVSKTGGWGFKSLRACKGSTMNREMKRAQAKAERQQKAAGLDRRSTPQAATKRVAVQEKRKRTSPLQFLREVRLELRKVDWPTRTELTTYSTVVLVTITVLTAFVFGVDYLLTKFIFPIFNYAIGGGLPGRPSRSYTGRTLGASARDRALGGFLSLPLGPVP